MPSTTFICQLITLGREVISLMPSIVCPCASHPKNWSLLMRIFSVVQTSLFRFHFPFLSCNHVQALHPTSSAISPGLWLQISHAEVVTGLRCHLMFMYKQSWWVVAAPLTFPRESVTCPSPLFFEGWMWEDHRALLCTKDLKPAGVSAQNNNNTLNFYRPFHPMIPKQFPLLNP